MDQNVLSWLLQGDVSIQYQVYRDLLGQDRPDLQMRIQKEGWGRMFLERQKQDGHWGLAFYQPKWTSTHYTLLDLRCLEINPRLPEIRKIIQTIAENHIGEDGGIRHSVSAKISDVCLNGMFLTYACYFGIQEHLIEPVVDYILVERMEDGGFNCRKHRDGARHSSLHSSLSVFEGISEYEKRGYSYRLDDLKDAKASISSFILKHRMFRSDRTGKVIHPAFLRFPFPPRWRYDILRALDAFRFAGTKKQAGMLEALEIIRKKSSDENFWPINAGYPGTEHFIMEKSGKKSRWNTLRALRVLDFYKDLSSLKT